MDAQTPRPLRITFLAHAIAMALFAGIYLFVPVWWGELTGCYARNVPAVYRLWGLTILGYAISSYLASRETVWSHVRILAQMNRVIAVLFPPLLIIAILVWSFPAIAWMPFVVMTAFAVAFNAFYPKSA